MIKLINPYGGITWVHEPRIEEYMTRGHKLAPPPPPPPKKKKPKKEA